MFAANIRDSIDEILQLPKRITGQHNISPRPQIRSDQQYYRPYGGPRGGYYRGRGQ